MMFIHKGVALYSSLTTLKEWPSSDSRIPYIFLPGELETKKKKRAQSMSINADWHHDYHRRHPEPTLLHCSQKQKENN